MQKIDTVLFDLDGTLVDSNELILKAFYETMKKYLPQREFSREELLEMIGPPLKETFKIATDNPTVILEMIDYYRKIYVENEFDYLDIYPNTIKMLKALSKRGINLGIVTTKFKDSAIPSIKHYGLDKYITSFCYLNDVTEHKPHPEPIHYALSQFKTYDRVIMVGDNTSDILAGKNANVFSCGIEWSIKKELIKNLKPDFWLNDYMDLVKIIDEFNKEE